MGNLTRMVNLLVNAIALLLVMVLTQMWEVLSD